MIEKLEENIQSLADVLVGARPPRAGALLRSLVSARRGIDFLDEPDDDLKEAWAKCPKCGQVITDLWIPKDRDYGFDVLACPRMGKNKIMTRCGFVGLFRIFS